MGGEHRRSSQRITPLNIQTLKWRKEERPNERSVDSVRRRKEKLYVLLASFKLTLKKKLWE